jgi:hypothetical protein
MLGRIAPEAQEHAETIIHRGHLVSAQVADPGITEAPPSDYQPLPAVTQDLFVVHYSSDPHAAGQNRTPAVSAIVVRNLFSGTTLEFAAFTDAEACGIPPGQFIERFPELERGMLRDFAEYTATHQEAVWVHWGMREAFFGFDVLNQRAKFHRQQYHGITPERRFDLSYYLAQRYGDDFSPHPRLWHAARRNLGAITDFLDADATAAVWERGEHGADLRSLYAKVDAIARLFERIRTGRFLTGAADLQPPPDLRPAGTSATRPDDPAFFRRSHTDAGESFDLKKMTDCHWAILNELYRREAFRHKSRVKTAALAVGVGGPNANSDSFKHPVAELAEYELVGTAAGQGGGVWLTRDGRLLVESRSNPSPRTVDELIG